MKKKLSMLLLSVLILPLIAVSGGCGGESESAGNNGDANTLVYGSQDYTAINPALFEHGEINALLFAGLTSHDEENNEVPALAESWDFNEETLTYTFHLREGLTFHDGEPLTAEDVEFTLNAILDEYEPTAEFNNDLFEQIVQDITVNDIREFSFRLLGDIELTEKINEIGRCKSA